MTGENMINLTDIDKLDETYSFRLPEVTKKQLDKLPSSLKKRLNLKFLLATAEILHESKFDARLYLTTRDISWQRLHCRTL